MTRQTRAMVVPAATRSLALVVALSMTAGLALLSSSAMPASPNFRLDDSSAFVRGAYGRDSSCLPPAGSDDNGCHWGSGVANMATDGFNVVQTDPYIYGGKDGGLDALAADGLKGIVYMGGWDNSSCSFTMTDSDFDAIVLGIKGDTVARAAAYAYYLGDEPHLSSCPSSPAAFAARTSRLHTDDSQAKSFTVIQENDNGNFGTAYYAKWMGAVDIVGFDVYPCHFANGADFNLAPSQKTRQACDMGPGGQIQTDAGYIEAAGFGSPGNTQYLALLQDFQDCYYELPTPADLRQQATDWSLYGIHMSGVVYFSWNFYGNPCTPPSPPSPVSVGVRLDDCTLDPNAAGALAPGTSCTGNTAELQYDNCHFFGGCGALCPATIGLPATETTTQFSVPLSSTCTVAYYELQEFDVTLNQGWYAISSPAWGFPGHTYSFRARVHTPSGLVGAWATGSTQVSSTATQSLPFSGMYTLNAYGGINADSSPPLAGSAYWPGWKIARSAHAQPGASAPQSGLVLDGYGGMHGYGAPITFRTSAYWQGWDIARDFAFLPDGTGGYVLDGYGGVHPFAVGSNSMPPAITGTFYWGWDIARKIVIFSDGTGGYVLDGYGGLHPFAIGSNPRPATPSGGAYWPGWQIARDLALIPGTHAGYLLDGYGGLHSFGGAPAASAVYWGWDIGRSVWLLPGATLSAPSGYVLDGYGGAHPFGGAPAVASPYWPGQDIGRTIWGA